MTVKDLIERLQEHPDYYEVEASFDDGDTGSYPITDVTSRSDFRGAAVVIR